MEHPVHTGTPPIAFFKAKFVASAKAQEVHFTKFEQENYSNPTMRPHF